MQVSHPIDLRLWPAASESTKKASGQMYRESIKCQHNCYLHACACALLTRNNSLLGEEPY